MAGGNFGGESVSVVGAAVLDGTWGRPRYWW